MKQLTPEQYHGLIRVRGYTMAEAAAVFGISAARLSQIANNPARAPYYDYAAWGLCPKRSAAAVGARRSRTLAKIAKPPLDHWALATQVGAVFLVQKEQGDHLPEGCEGVVTKQIKIGGRPHVAIHFEKTNYTEAFALAYLKDQQCFLWATGRVMPPRGALAAHD